MRTACQPRRSDLADRGRQRETGLVAVRLSPVVASSLTPRFVYRATAFPGLSGSHEMRSLRVCRQRRAMGRSSSWLPLLASGAILSSFDWSENHRAGQLQQGPSERFSNNRWSEEIRQVSWLTPTSKPPTSTRGAVAECDQRALQRQVSRRVPEPGVVSQSRGGASPDRELAATLQRDPSTFESRLPDPETVH